MKAIFLSLGLLCFLAVSAMESKGDEARAMVYVVDRA